MRVQRLVLTDFRSYEHIDVELDQEVTTLLGRNGQGKTNLVEAIRFLSVGQSHRTASAAPLIRVGSERAVIRAKVVKGRRELSLETTINSRGANAARINGAPARPREVFGLIRSVAFSPEDLDIVSGDPRSRRAFLDEIAVAASPALAGDIADYERVLRQRATLLKTARGKTVDLGTLDVWDAKLVECGTRIVAARLAAVDMLRTPVAESYRELASDAGELTMEYRSTTYPDLDTPTDISGSFGLALADARPKELERGVCLVGPHRDDLDLAIDGLAVRTYASHGERWSAALALRLGTFDVFFAEAQHLGEGGEPVMILDDVFAELDGERRAALVRRIHQADQVLITAAVAEDVPTELVGDVVHVAGGTVTRDD